MKTKISLVKCTNYNFAEVDQAVDKALSLLGGMENFIKPGSKVLIKPNILTDAVPEDCLTTHPAVVEAVIKALKKLNCEIFVGDSPGVIGQIKRVEHIYEATGIKSACEKQGVNLVYFDSAVIKNKIPMADWVDRCDYFINIPKFKTHSLTVITAAIKNLYGLVLGMHKARLHRDHLGMEEFSRKIVDIFQLAKPTLNIVDGVTSIEGEGPGSAGTKFDSKFILIGQDAVAVDSVLAVMAGLKPLDIPTTKEAAMRGLGEAELFNIEILGEKLNEFIFKNFKLPKMSRINKMPRPLLEIAKKFVWYKMAIDRDACIACRRCIESCPVDTIYLKKGKAFIDTSRCILCSCCQEICPKKAVGVRKSPLLRMLGV